MATTLELGAKIPHELSASKYNCGERMARRYPNGTVYLYEAKHVLHPSGDIGPRKPIEEVSFDCGEWFELSNDADDVALIIKNDAVFDAVEGGPKFSIAVHNNTEKSVDFTVAAVGTGSKLNHFETGIEKVQR